jgi:hypothetical protein
MDAKLLEIVGQVAGIGGLALGVLLIVFRDIIRKNIFPKLPSAQAYRLLRLIIGAVWSVAVIGIIAWVYVNAIGGDANGAVWAQASACGDPPIVVEGFVKGEIDAKANVIKSFIGDVALKGQIELAKNDVLQRYPNADQLRLKQYFLYVICLQIMTDTKLDTLAKIKAYTEASQIVFPPPPKEKNSGIVREIMNFALNDFTQERTFSAPAGAVIEVVGPNCNVNINVGGVERQIPGNPGGFGSYKVPVIGAAGQQIPVTVRLRTAPSISCFGKFLVTAADS